MHIPIVIEIGNRPNEEHYNCYASNVPGCITTADTFEAVMANMKEALELYFEENPPLPQCRSLETIAKDMKEDDILAANNLDLERPRQSKNVFVNYLGCSSSSRGLLRIQAN